MASVALIAAWVSLIGGIALLVLSALGLMHSRRPASEISATTAEAQPAPVG